MVQQTHVAHVMSRMPSHHLSCSPALPAQKDKSSKDPCVCVPHGLLYAVARGAAGHRVPSTQHSFWCRAHEIILRRNRRGLLRTMRNFCGDASAWRSRGGQLRVGAAQNVPGSLQTSVHVLACGSHLGLKCVSRDLFRDAACATQTCTRPCGACDHRRPCRQLLVRPG